ncbi:MAG: hypothetical protein H3C28_03995 [Sphingomonadales bacterium]|nr:hypothetical protein [Sphingomonadales bacterium]
MFKKPLHVFLLTSAMAAGVPFGAALAENGASNDVFYDKTRLIDTALADDQAELDAAQAAVDSAQATFDAANAELSALQDQIAGLSADDPGLTELQAQADALQDKIDHELSPALSEAQGELSETQAGFDAEQALLANEVDNLSSDQLFAFNRSLNNAVAQGLIVNLDAEDLQAAIDGDYDKHQINALTKALEEEAKFLSRADMFEQKAAETGDVKFLEKADRMRDRAEEQKERFLAKLENDHDSNHDDAQAAKDARDAAKAANEAAREAAKEQHEIAREAAKDAQEAAKEAAQEAREAAKEAQEAAREAAKEAAKMAAKD